jgi:hypothetical protein
MSSSHLEFIRTKLRNGLTTWRLQLHDLRGGGETAAE